MIQEGIAEAKANRNYLSLNSKEKLLGLEWDEFCHVDRDEFVPIENMIEMDSDFDSKFCWATYLHCPNTQYEFHKLRIIETSALCHKYFYFVAPAIKLNDEMRGKKKSDELPKRPYNKLGLEAGKVIDIEDLPKQKLDNTNSYYDPKLKRRVPLLAVISNEPKEKEKKEPKQKKEIKQKVETEMLNNTDIRHSHTCMHSSDFLPPLVCTRIWTLDIGHDVGWWWFVRPVDGEKNKVEYYCRPDQLTEDWMEQYDRGGTKITKAYLKAQFPMFTPPVYEHKFLVEIAKNSDDKKIAINAIIDAQLIKWK